MMTPQNMRSEWVFKRAQRSLKALVERFDDWLPRWLVDSEGARTSVVDLILDCEDLKDPGFVDVDPARPVNLLLAGDAVLTKEVSLPPHAGPMIDRAVDLSLRQTLPAQASGLRWRIGHPVMVGNRLVVTAYIVKAKHIDTVLERAASKGITIRRFGIASGRGVQPFFEIKSPIKRRILAWAILSISIPISFTLAVVTSDIYKTKWNTQRIVELNGQSQSEIENLVDMEHELLSEVSSNENESEIISYLESIRGRIQIIRSLTDTLNDEEWLTELNIFESQMRISGFSAVNPVDLIDRLNEKDWLNQARFDTPVVLDPISGGRRFDIVFDLK